MKSQEKFSLKGSSQGEREFKIFKGAISIVVDLVVRRFGELGQSKQASTLILSFRPYKDTNV